MIMTVRKPDSRDSNHIKCHIVRKSDHTTNDAIKVINVAICVKERVVLLNRSKSVGRNIARIFRLFNKLAL